MSRNILRVLLAFIVLAISVEFSQGNKHTEVVVSRRQKRQFGCGPQCGLAGCCGVVCCVPPPPPPPPCCAPPPPPPPPPPPCCLPPPPPPPPLPCCVPFCPPVCRPACVPACIASPCGARGCGRKKRDLLRSQRSHLTDQEADMFGLSGDRDFKDISMPINDWGGYTGGYAGSSGGGSGYGGGNGYVGGEYSGGAYNLGGFGGGNGGNGYGGYGGTPADCRLC